VPNPKTPFATSNAKSLNAKSSALTRDAKCSTAPSASLYAKHLTALLIAKLPSQNARLFAKSPNATGNATNPTAPSLNVSLFAKTPTAFPRLNAALAQWEEPESLLLSHSSKKLLIIKIVVLAINKL
jgi:hypothetical protein